MPKQRLKAEPCTVAEEGFRRFNVEAALSDAASWVGFLLRGVSNNEDISKVATENMQRKSENTE